GSGSLCRRNAGGCKHDVLFAAVHIGHWYPRLCSGRNLRFPDNLPCLLVVGAKHRLTAVPFTGEQECFRDENSCARFATSARKVHTFEQRVILDLGRRVAVRNLPGDLTASHIDCGDSAVWRLDDGNALDVGYGPTHANHSHIRLAGLRRGDTVIGGVSPASRESV